MKKSKNIFVRLIEKILDRLEKDSTAPVMVDHVVAQVLSDKELSRQFNEGMRRGDLDFTIENKGKKFTVQIIR